MYPSQDLQVPDFVTVQVIPSHKNFIFSRAALGKNNVSLGGLFLVKMWVSFGLGISPPATTRWWRIGSFKVLLIVSILIDSVTDTRDNARYFFQFSCFLLECFLNVIARTNGAPFQPQRRCKSSTRRKDALCGCPGLALWTHPFSGTRCNLTLSIPSINVVRSAYLHLSACVVGVQWPRKDVFRLVER